MVDIVAEGFDLGVRVADLVPSDTIAVPLGRPQRYAVVGSPAYFKKHERPRVPPDLLDHPCVRVRLPNGALYRWQCEKRGRTAQIDVNGPITLDEASLARTAVLEGIGLGFFMEPDVRADMEAGHLIRVLEDWTPPRTGLSLYYPGRRNPSAALRLSSTWPAISAQKPLSPGSAFRQGCRRAVLMYSTICVTTVPQPSWKPISSCFLRLASSPWMATAR